MLRRSRISFCNTLLVLLGIFATNARAATIAWSPVGNPGNLADTRTYQGVPTNLGTVNYSYSIGTYDITNAQYVEFLNAKDSTGADPLGLYNTGTRYSTYGGITYNPGASDGSKYSAIAADANHPVNYVTVYDALRFANWVNNGQGNGDTETGAYTLLGGTPTPSNAATIARNAGATVVLPTLNEWYKAAYYDSTTKSYFLFPTSSNSIPNAILPGSIANSANYMASDVGTLSNVGAYSGTHSPSGAFDMGGNVFQMNEDLLKGGTNLGVRGGSFDNDYDLMYSVLPGIPLPATAEGNDVGFRLAMIVPEPSSAVLAALGFVGLAAWGWRRKRS